MSHFIAPTLRITPLGDQGLNVQSRPAWTPVQASLFLDRVRGADLPGLVDGVAAFNRITLFYDPLCAASDARYLDGLIARLQALATAVPAGQETESRPIIDIPVDYSPAAGPDLQRLADERRWSVAHLIERHASRIYTVAAIGFLPGFAYLAGLPKRLQAPRLATPRPRVPAGSVAIGGEYTGIYPSESPGGWNIIGRTSVVLFDVTRTPAALLRAGQRVRFIPESRR